MKNPKAEGSKQTTFNSFFQMLEMLPNEEACREFLEYIRWEGVPVCPHCGSQSKAHYELKYKGVFKGLRKCKDCRERFTITVGTMFEGSHIPLRKWFIATYIFSAHKKGVSSHQLARDLGLTQKSAWFMLSRLRSSYGIKSEEIVKIVAPVQCDETYVGGKNKNRHKDKKVKDSQGRSVKDKTPVFGLFSEGIVNTVVVPNTKKETLRPLIEKMVEEGAIIITDEHTAYNDLIFDYEHKSVKHSENEYMKDGFHTNSIEGFWSLLKRGIFGIYHSVSPKHLNLYCDEFSYRYNTRELGDHERFSHSLKNATERLTYEQLIKKC